MFMKTKGATRGHRVQLELDVNLRHRVASKSVGKRPTAALPACAEKLRSREFFSKQSQNVIENKRCTREGPRMFNKTKVLS